MRVNEKNRVSDCDRQREGNILHNSEGKSQKQEQRTKDTVKEKRKEQIARKKM